MATRKKRAPAPRSKARRSAARGPLTSLTSDWYWEQDAELRFTRVDVQTGTPGEQELARNIVGKRRWETDIDIEGGWAAHRALLKTRAPFREVMMWREFDDGSRRYMSVSGEPVFDAKGRFTGYRGVGRDVTGQKRGEQLLRLQHTVTSRLAEAAEPARAFEGALHAICESEGWDYAEFWRKNQAKGVEVIGVVFDSGEPQEIQDFVRENRIPYRQLLGDDRLQEAFQANQGFPTTFVIDGQGIIRTTILGSTPHKFERLQQTVDAALVAR